LVAYRLASSGRAIGGGEGGSGVPAGTARGDVAVGGTVDAVLPSGGAGVHPASTPTTTTQIAIFAAKPITPGSPTLQTDRTRLFVRHIGQTVRPVGLSHLSASNAAKTGAGAALSVIRMSCAYRLSMLLFIDSIDNR
jgi:hypothetical protein